jgi:glycosyltransferase involved in cell wall biosynthesis
MLGAVGRIDPESAADDPSFRDLIDVVPFGVESTAPTPTTRVLKGVVPGIEHGDKVVLWGGGIWNWLDPITPIRAIHALARKREDVKLFFLGVRHPNPGVQQLAMTTRAVALAEELGLRDRFVFFNFGWVPYAERANYLLEADVGISSHLETLETRFSFRTRVLDYFWAGLPTVATEGDVLSDLVAEQDLGRIVAVGDVEGWTRALEELVDDRAAYARVRANVEQAREAFAWPRVVEPLLRLVALPGAVIDPPRRAGAMTLHYNTLALGSILLRRGVLGGARETVRLIRRPPVP